jgi:Apc15p protein
MSLANDERLLASRKTAIAMYGYSWLKPAGCTKTMLGRREEELEREEVERQTREAEMQERITAEANEADRLQQIREMQERGEVVAEGERDLDAEVPDADQTQQTIDEGEGDEMEGDLDDDIPDADGADSDNEEEFEEEYDSEAEDAQQSPAFGEGWTYDSRREPDTDEEDGTAQRLTHNDGRFSHLLPQPQRADTQGRARPAVGRAAAGLEEDYGYGVDEREAAAFADAMLDEDELGQLPSDRGDDGDRDLDEDVPNADEDAWEHTDTELEDDSEMDMSLLPLTHQLRADTIVRSLGRQSSGSQFLPLPSVDDHRRLSGRPSPTTRVVSGNAARRLLPGTNKHIAPTLKRCTHHSHKQMPSSPHLLHSP